MLNKIAVACFSALSVSSMYAQQKPNVLFIMTDQQRYDALGMAGKYKFLKTPNLDKLGREGVVFERAYTQCAVSAPARGTLFTGCTIENHGIYTNDFDKNSSLKMKTFDEVLVENGYYTEYHGKFHSPDALKKCYAQFSDIKDYKTYLEAALPKQKPNKGERMSEFKQPYKLDPMDAMFGIDENISPKEMVDKNGKPMRFTQPDYHGELIMPAQYSLTTYQANQTIEAIKRAKKSGKPFAITCSFTFPHAPMLPTKPFYGMYPLDQMPIPLSIKDDMTNSPYIVANNRNTKPEYSDPVKLKYMMANYFALVSEIDAKVGEILESLKKQGLDKNTLVIFTSDHGEMLGAHGMREKNVFLEESARVPLLMRMPEKIKKGRVVQNNLSTMNLYATILDYLEIKNPGSDGNTLKPLIDGTKTDKFDFVVTEWNFQMNDKVPNYMIVKDGWKLFIPYTASSKVLDALYDLNKDPYEMNNLLGKSPNKKRFQEKANDLKQDLLKWLKEKNSSHYDGVLARQL